MSQYIVKDARGNMVLARDRIVSYTIVARELLTIAAVRPVSVWRHDTITGQQSYDGDRTRRLSDAICAQTPR